jgi:dTDP-glucose 4,6-dehydratase
MRAVITGGAGFLGSHLSRRLLDEGFEVVCLDTLLTGSEDNIADLVERPGYSFVRKDVSEYIEVDGPVDWVLHLASPASPVRYLEHPIKTLKVGGMGTWRCLGLARAKEASFLLASTSEVYGDPKVHPQPETYWGNVNPIGPRGVYDEAKRYAEAMTMAYHRAHGIPVRIVRIFNTYGPYMSPYDGRAVPAFIDQALSGRPLTVHGDGSQTRSLCYVDDLIEGIWALLNSDLTGPVNLGNPHEVTVKELAETVCRVAGVEPRIVYTERPVDDPERRCPDITFAREALGWEPKVDLEEGLSRTVEWFMDKRAGGGS